MGSHIPSVTGSLREVTLGLRIRSSHVDVKRLLGDMLVKAGFGVPLAGGI
jgi:hypothetical protein